MYSHLISGNCGGSLATSHRSGVDIHFYNGIMELFLRKNLMLATEEGPAQVVKAIRLS